MAGLSGFGGLVANPFEVGGNALANMPAQVAQLQQQGALALAPYGQALKENPSLWNDSAWRARVDSLGGMFGIPTASLIVAQNAGIATKTTAPPAQSQSAQPQSGQPQSPQSQSGQPPAPQPAQQGPHASVVSGDISSAYGPPGVQQPTSPQQNPPSLGVGIGSPQNVQAYQNALAKAQQMPSLISGSTTQSKAYINRLHQLGLMAGITPQQITTDIQRASMAHAVAPGKQPVVTPATPGQQPPSGQQVANQNAVTNASQPPPGGASQSQWAPPPMTQEEQLSMAESPLLAFLGIKPNMVSLQNAGLTAQDIQMLSELAPGAQRAQAMQMMGINIHDPDAVAFINSPQLMGTAGQVEERSEQYTAQLGEAARAGNMAGAIAALQGLDQINPVLAHEDEQYYLPLMQRAYLQKYQQAVDQHLISQARYNQIEQSISATSSLIDLRRAETAQHWETVDEMPEHLQIALERAQSDAIKAYASASQASTSQQRLGYSYYQQAAQNWRTLTNASASYARTITQMGAQNLSFDPTTMQVTGLDGKPTTVQGFAQQLAHAAAQAQATMNAYPGQIRTQLPGKSPSPGDNPPVIPGATFLRIWNGHYWYRNNKTGGGFEGSPVAESGVPSSSSPQAS